MKKTLYLECYAGISGDMTVAALLDLGADQAVMEQTIASLPLHGYEIQVRRVKKSGVDACDFNVVLDQHHENHDHDMEYLHGHEERGLLDESHDHHGHAHSHEEHAHSHEEHAHSHEEHVHSHEEHAHSHEEPVHSHEEHAHTHDGRAHISGIHVHRGMKEIREIINHGDLTEGARKLAFEIFEILAKAEAKAHRVPVEEVHFHEVGAVDSIIDIVAAAVCFDNLGITDVVITGLYEGYGTVRCQHGVLPIPVPAVSNILQEQKLPVHLMDVKGEFITPTGAAIAAAIRTAGELPEAFTIEKIGIGAGKRTYERPSVVRAMLICE